MNIDEIERSLPNGFHDATINKLEIDYINRILKMEMDIDVSDSNTTTIIPKKVVLNVTGLVFCAIEPPDLSFSSSETKGAWTTGSDPEKPEKLSFNVLSPTPSSAFEHYFFISDWNAFIAIVAMDANLEHASQDVK